MSFRGYILIIKKSEMYVPRVNNIFHQIPDFSGKATINQMTACTIYQMSYFHQMESGFLYCNKPSDPVLLPNHLKKYLAQRSGAK